MSTDQKKLVIFQLGTNHWQKPYPGGLEIAPGSGHLHYQHHAALNGGFQFGDSVNTVSYSIYPSEKQRPSAAETSLEKYRVFEIDHQVFVCESAGPTSRLRWHSLSEERIASYLERLQQSVEAYIAEIEAAEKQEIGMMIAHHCFTNPVVAARVNEKRIAAGKSKIPLFVFGHGTALKMFQNELASIDEFPLRFYPWMNKLGIFDKSNVKSCVDGVFVISDDQLKTFCSLFPSFPVERILTTPNGYNAEIFKPPATPAEAVPETASALKTIKPVYVESVVASLSSAEIRDKIRAIQARTEPGIPLPVGKKIKIAVFAGRLVTWKRVEVLLAAAKQYTADVGSQSPDTAVITIIMGTATDCYVEQCHRIAYEELKLDPNSVFFVGAQPQDVMSGVNGAASVGILTSKNEPFGLVAIEQMACRLPVVAARSGGPASFVLPEVGALVPENDDGDQLATAFARVVTEAIVDDWKSTKGKRAAEYASKEFTTSAQCRLMMTTAADWIEADKKKKNGSAPSTAAGGEQKKKASLLSDYLGVVVVGAVLALGLWKQYGSKL